jgi:hypothetical protein
MPIVDRRKHRQELKSKLQSVPTSQQSVADMFNITPATAVKDHAKNIIIKYVDMGAIREKRMKSLSDSLIVEKCVYAPDEEQYYIFTIKDSKNTINLSSKLYTDKNLCTKACSRICKLLQVNPPKTWKSNESAILDFKPFQPHE